MEGETHVLVGDDTQVELTLPFPFEFYNQWYGTAYASTNGFVHFEPSLQTSFFNVPVPNIYLPDAAVYVLWDNLVFDPVVDPECGLWTAEGTSDEGRQWFLVEWRHAAFFDDPVRRVDAEVLLFEDGEILTQYRDIDPDARERGAGAGLGLEDEEGEVGFQYSHREASIGTPDFAVRYIHLPFGAVTGRVLDANDGLPIEGAGITASDASHNPIRDDRTDDQGAYRLPLPVGSYTVSATADDYVTGTEAVTIQADGHEPDVVLHLATGHPEVTPPAVAFAGDGDATVMLVNTGSAALSWHLFEEVNGRPVDVAWLSVEPSSGGLAAGESVELSLTAVTADMMSGSYVAAAVLTSDAGRLPRLEIPVTLTVGSPGASLAVNCGGGGWVDNDGAVWLADQAHATGSWGYTDHRARTRDTDEDIAGSVDDTVFQSLLRRPGSYRFDGLPAGTYTIELSFAEIEPEVVAGDRIFDVVAGGADLLSSFDIVASVGRLTAHRPEPFTVEVGTGPLEIRFDAARRSLPAVINGIRLVQELE